MVARSDRRGQIDPPAPPAAGTDPSSASLRFLGHATVLLDLVGLSVLTDPVLRPSLGPLRRHGDSVADVADLASDIVLISHAHHDHLDPGSLRLLPGEPEIVVPTGVGGYLRRQGFRRVREIAQGETIVRADSAITATPARHGGRRGPLGPRGPALGFRIDSRAGTVYFAGDTDLFEAMRALAPIDLALLPVWGWGPRLGPGHLDPERAARAAAMIGAQLAVPIHWGTLWPRGMARIASSRLQTPPREFADAVGRLAPAVTVVIVAPGEGLAFGQRPDAAAVDAANHRSS